MSLIVKNLEVELNGRAILPALSFEVKDGHCVTLMGPSGIGKSTLLKAISGSLPHELKCRGDIFLNDRPITNLAIEKRNIGMLQQDPLLFPHLSVGENLAFGIPKIRQNRMELVTQALERVGLDGMEMRDPATLSGGEAARIALERALLAEPDAILLDEPFAKLDKDRRQDIRRLVFDEIRHRQIPAILVTHDLEDANSAGGVVLTLKKAN